MKVCVLCNKELPITEFYRYGNKTHNKCKECHKKVMKAKYDEKVEALQKYKEGIGCQKCGECRGYLLDFHHKDPSQKDFQISDKTRAGLNSLMDEIKKCVVVCSNCHREIHYLSARDEKFSLDEYLAG